MSEFSSEEERMRWIAGDAADAKWPSLADVSGEITRVQIVNERGEVVRELPTIDVPGEEVFVPHSTLRLWPPPPVDDGGVPGEFDVTLRGSLEDYYRFHRALIGAGFYIADHSSYEVYVFPERGDVAHGCEGA